MITPTRKFPEDSIESQVYKIVEDNKDYLPILNDRNRLGYGLYLYVKGQGDKPEVLVRNSKLTLKNISEGELVKRLEEGLNKLEIK